MGMDMSTEMAMGLSTWFESRRGWLSSTLRVEGGEGREGNESNRGRELGRRVARMLELLAVSDALSSHNHRSTGWILNSKTSLLRRSGGGFYMDFSLATRFPRSDIRPVTWAMGWGGYVALLDILYVA